MTKSATHTLEDQIEVANFLSLATKVALQLKPETKFSAFAAEGHGACLLLDGTIFGYIAHANGDKAMVLKTGHQDLEVNDFVHLQEVGYYAFSGEGYYPSSVRDPRIENKRVAMFDILLSAIAAEGGHEAVLQAIKMRNGKKDEVRRIVKDMKSGVLPSNLLDMFSDMKKAKALGIIVNNSPLVFYRAYQRMQVKDVWKHVLVIRLGLAPHGVEGFDIGTFVPLANLFIEHSNKHVAQMVKVLVESISPKDLDEVKRLTHDLAVTEGRILEVEAEDSAPLLPEIIFKEVGAGESDSQILH